MSFISKKVFLGGAIAAGLRDSRILGEIPEEAATLEVSEGDEKAAEILAAETARQTLAEQRKEEAKEKFQRGLMPKDYHQAEKPTDESEGEQLSLEEIRQGFLKMREGFAQQT